MSTPQYWGGTARAGAPSGDVRPLDAKTFDELVAGYINAPVLIPMTRAEFAAKPKTERGAIKAGPYITACSFKNEHRKDANADRLMLACFDLDGGSEVRGFVSYPEALADALYPYNFVAYHTVNSTEGDPRMRVMVDVQPCDPAEHRRIVAHLMDRMGLAKDFAGYRESNVLSQPMYRPNTFQGEDGTSPVICSRTDGEALVPGQLPAMDETEGDQRRYGNPDAINEAFGLAYLPVADLTVEDVREAVMAIDSDCTYRPWIEVCAALRHQFRDEESAQAAFELYEEWSQRGTKFVEGEPWRKWRSIRPDATGRAPVTIRTLFHHAKVLGGWKDTATGDKLQASVEDWIAGQQDVKSLLAEGTKRIIAMPLLTPTREEHLISVLRAKYKALSGMTLDRAAVRKELSNLKAQKRADGGNQKPDWLRPYVFVGSTNTFNHRVNQTTLSPEAFDNMFGEKLVSSAEPDEDEEPNNGRPAIQPRNFALNIAKIDRVDETAYCPLHGRNADGLVTIEGRKYLNTYNPSSVPTEDPTLSKQAGKLFKAHMRLLVGEQDMRRTFIDFLCAQVQHPGRKTRWCPVIQSAEGVGKGILRKIMAAVMGEPNVGVISPTVMSSQWNDWQVGVALNILEEIRLPGESREAIMNAMKQPIADDLVTVNKRNTSARTWSNYTNYVGFTNHKDALYLKNGDRRWCVIESPIQTDADVAEVLATGHFEQVEILFGAWAGALRHWMMNWEISEDFPWNGPAPKTRYREAVIENSKNTLQVSIEKLIADPNETWIGDDVIHYERLLALTEYEARRNAKPSHYLRVMGYEPAGTCMIEGAMTEVFTHPKRYFAELGTPQELLEMRI